LGENPGIAIVEKFFRGVDKAVFPAQEMRPCPLNRHDLYEELIWIKKSIATDYQLLING
jgi:hypothetical protein